MAELRSFLGGHGMLAVAYAPSELPKLVPPEAVAQAAATDRERLQRAFELSTAWRPARWNDTVCRYLPLPGIALHKLCSNDWWLITAEECREALEAWQAGRTCEGEQPPDWIAECLDFLRRVSRRAVSRSSRAQWALA